jgi:hypothetical protein
LGRGGGERPVRIQIIVALVATLILVAIPLYLWRRPQPESIPSADAAVAPPPQGPNTVQPLKGLPPISAPSASFPGARLDIAPVKTLKCQNAGPGKTPAERCDGVRFFEDALVTAIRESHPCAPPSRSGYVMSYVLEFHFGKKKMSLYSGKSTTLAKSKRRELLKCAERSLPVPEWDRIVHQHQKYTITTVVTYPPTDTPVAESPGDAAPQVAAPHAKPKSNTKTTKPKKP